MKLDKEECLSNILTDIKFMKRCQLELVEMISEQILIDSEDCNAQDWRMYNKLLTLFQRVKERLR